jgi:hypothetical protein
MSKKYAFHEEVKLRIREARDDITKEPTLSISETKEIYVQQMHTRPGRYIYMYIYDMYIYIHIYI